jgi:uncharacterized protein (DUF488 family)
MATPTLYTIGFTKKSARSFFTLLKENHIIRILDVRLNNSSQLAGYTKRNDLEYFLGVICSCSYRHIPELAPTKEILDAYHAKKISWFDYEKQFNLLLAQRAPQNLISSEEIDRSCLLCAEADPEKCHRRLVAEYLQNTIKGLTVRHL